MREMAEELRSPRVHHDHLYGASMSPATRDVKLFQEPLPRSWECRTQPLICTGPAMVELNRQAARDEKGKDRANLFGHYDQQIKITDLL